MFANPRFLLLSIVGSGLFVGLSLLEAAEPAREPTHQLASTIPVNSEAQGLTLQTMCLDGSGRVLALVAPSRYTSPGEKGQAAANSEIQVFDADGKKQATWKVSFSAQSINAEPTGNVLVAGSGRIARLDASGKTILETDVPHLALLLKDTEKLHQRAKEQLETEQQSYQETLKSFQDQLKELKAKDSAKLNPQDKARLRMLEQNVKMYEQVIASRKARKVEDVVKSLTDRLRIINSVTATEKDIFIACGETKGYGYAIWRMDHDFKNPKQIASGLGGCCGQMDIQARGEDLYVAENTRHRVIHYTREGKQLATFGKRGREGEAECFGGCCNPMNLRIASDGSVYTAESEGNVKLFSPKGEFVGEVGKAQLAGGCKNVAVAVSSDGNRIYFCDQPGKKIIVLNRKQKTTQSGQ